MSNLTETRAVEASLKIYRRLLAAYPHEHRQEYGRPMEQLFRDQCRDAWNDTRSWGLVKLWMRVIPDLLRTSVSEHLTVLKRRKPMFSLFSPRATPLFVFTGVFSVVFLLVVSAAVIVTSCLPTIYRSTARIRLESNFVNIDPYVLQAEFETMQSWPVLRRAADQINLVQKLSKEYPDRRELDEYFAVSFLKHSLYLRPIRNTSIVEISAYSANPQDAALIANAVANSYRVYSTTIARESGLDRVPSTRRVDIIDYAVPNPTPYAPKKALNIFLGAIFGVVLGAVAGAASAGFVFVLRRRHGPANSLHLSGATS